MNKRSAMLMAAGLVLTLVVGGVAISAGLTGPTASAATPRVVQHHHRKPIVKTFHKTITVHKQAPSSGAVTYAAPATAPTAPTVSPYPVTQTHASSGGYHDDGGSDDGHAGGGGGDD